MAFNLEALITKPIYKIVGIVVVLAVYVGLIPTLITSVTSYCALAGLGVFGTVMGTILPLLVGVAAFYIGIREIMKLMHG